ncbi:MAG: tryptophan--tRNA ligase [Actinomycetia bacterium]|nr:tryptophan--tRNA ligase [Actinomycetes bacterium]MCP4084211.1 tryptophan--tRNA ligase [Actinomycetes bacterium]
MSSTSTAQARVFSGIKPTGGVHLGNLLGALRNWVEDQYAHDAVYCVVDLHALTVPQDPAELRAATIELAHLLMAIGLDSELCTLFVQSHVPAHAELAWLMECTASFGELRRMTQFKDKSEGSEFVSAGLFTYPALMAADILLYDAERVPVGDDQRQHLELTRDVAIRFNSRYGDTFVVPEAAIPRAGARVMDLQEPTNKMSKSDDTSAGCIMLLDDLDSIEKKIKRAVTDTDSEVRFDIAGKPGVSNLLSILGAATGREPEEVAEGYSQYGPLKADTAEAVIEMLRPIQARFTELATDPGETARLLEVGADKARSMAHPVLARARQSIGLTAR